MISSLILVFILWQDVKLAKVIPTGVHEQRDVHNGTSVESKVPHSTCKVRTHGSSANIVCNFGIDVNAVRNDFQVDHFKKKWSRKHSETVFMIKRTKGKTEYRSRRGYQLQGIISSTVTLTIPELSEEHAGLYMCSVIPSDSTEVEMCDLPLEVIPTGVHEQSDVHTGTSDESKGKRSTCKVEIHGSSANIVCNFGIDVNAVRNDFQVDHFKKERPRKRSETVFMIKRTQGKTEYRSRRGYQLQGIISSTVTLKIPELSEEHAGLYMCSVIPSDSTEVEMCDLPLEVIPTGVHEQRDVHNGTSDESKVRMDFDKRISYENTVSPQYSSDEGTESHLSPLVIGVSVVAGFVVFLVIAIASIVFYRRRKGHIRQSGSHNQPLL